MNKIFLTGIVSTIGAAGLALSGCGAGVPESKEALIEEGLKKIAESSSFSGTLSQNSNINFTVLYMFHAEQSIHFRRIRWYIVNILGGVF